MRTIFSKFITCILGLLIAGCVTTSNPSNAPLRQTVPHQATEWRELRIEKPDAGSLSETNWVGTWHDPHQDHPDGAATASFQKLPSAGLYQLGMLQAEFVYHNPPGVKNPDDLKSEVRFPKKEGEFLPGVILNGKMKFEGDKVSYVLFDSGDGCLVLTSESSYRNIVSGTGPYTIFKNCGGGERFAGIVDRNRSIATAPPTGTPPISQ